MDYPQNRIKYIERLPLYFDLLTLSPPLIELIKNFNSSLWANAPPNQNPPEEIIKLWILLELTKSRESCNRIIRILMNSGNEELVRFLQECNTSPGHINYGDEIDIDVIPMIVPNTTYSQNYPMTKDPRGRAVIINLVPEEVQREALRFSYIFEKFKFKVKMPLCRSTTDIINELKKVEKKVKGDQALIVMVITHGVDNMIIGRDHPSLGGTDESDIVKINKIVNIFSDIGDTVKLFFFTCCREITINKPSGIALALNTFKGFLATRISPNNSQRNIENTFIYYSCAEGSVTPIENGRNFTPYGRALSECFAQFAHTDDMASIMNRTYKLMKDRYGYIRDVGRITPENNQRGTTHKLFFNPCVAD